MYAEVYSLPYCSEGVTFLFPHAVETRPRDKNPSRTRIIENCFIVKYYVV